MCTQIKLFVLTDPPLVEYLIPTIVGKAKLATEWTLFCHECLILCGEQGWIHIRWIKSDIDTKVRLGAGVSLCFQASRKSADLAFLRGWGAFSQSFYQRKEGITSSNSAGSNCSNNCELQPRRLSPVTTVTRASPTALHSSGPLLSFSASMRHSLWQKPSLPAAVKIFRKPFAKPILHSLIFTVSGREGRSHWGIPVVVLPVQGGGDMWRQQLSICRQYFHVDVDAVWYRAWTLFCLMKSWHRNLEPFLVDQCCRGGPMPLPKVWREGEWPLGELCSAQPERQSIQLSLTIQVMLSTRLLQNPLVLNILTLSQLCRSCFRSWHKFVLAH